MKKLVILSFTIGLIPQAYAVPTAFPNGNWNLDGLKNPTTSVILADSADPRQAWVMPPLAGSAIAKGLKGASANMGLCGQMADLQSSSQELIREIGSINSQIGPAAKDMQARQDAYYAKLEVADKYLVGTPSIKQAVDLQNSIDSLNQRLDSNYDRMMKCSPADSDACQAILKEIDNLQVEIKSEIKNRDDLQKTVGRELRTYQQKQGLAETAKQEWLDSTKTLMTIRGQLVEAQMALMGMYSYFAKIEGGYVSIDYNTGWDASVTQLSQANPGFVFTKIPTQDVHVNASFTGAKDKASYLQSLPIVLDYTVNGQAGLPYGPQGDNALAAMPSRMSATPVFSLQTVGVRLLKPASVTTLSRQTGRSLIRTTLLRRPTSERSKRRLKLNL